MGYCVKNQNDFPSKNRVWDFFSRGECYAGDFQLQVVEVHQEKEGVGTMIASGRVEHYQYDPFGNITHQKDFDTTGVVHDNPYRFSTKFTDDETGLVYYGFRFYSTVIGRWLNRDPVGERGGANLYGFVFNKPLFLIDYLGLVDCQYEFVVDHAFAVDDYVDGFEEGCSSGASGAGCGTQPDSPNGGIPGVENPGPYLGSNNNGDDYDTSNGGYNPEEYANDPKTGKAIGYAKYISAQWKRTLDHAKKQAEDCKCDCKEIVAKFVCSSSAAQRIHRENMQLAQGSGGWSNDLIDAGNGDNTYSVPPCGQKVEYGCKKRPKKGS